MKELKVPKGQKAWVRYLKNGEPVFIITSNVLRDKYYLYEVDSKRVLTKKATSTQPVFKELKYWEEY